MRDTPKGRRIITQKTSLCGSLDRKVVSVEEENQHETGEQDSVTSWSQGDSGPDRWDSE